MDFLKLVHEEIKVAELMKLVSSPTCGATSIFVGTTRDNFEGKSVKRLVYEAYDGMALKALKKVCDDIRSRWSVHGIAIYHRLGDVSVLETSIAIAISSEHRAESLQAVQYAIDTLKAEVPIWKKEEYNDSQESQWKQNKECAWIKTEPQDNVASEVSGVSEIMNEVSPDLIQVKADDSELKRRIEAFMEFKRNQVNQSNIRDFCGNANDPESSCARVDAVVVRQKDSKGHLRVRRVLNLTGPQTRGIEKWPINPKPPAINIPVKQEFSQKPVSNQAEGEAKYAPPAVEERLRNAEVQLGLIDVHDVRPVPKDVYVRLKDLEDRIFFLEGVSPEYSQILTRVPKVEPVDKKPNTFKKRVYSVDDLDRRMNEMQKSMKKDS